MQLTLHVRENLIRLGDAEVQGRHRWEAALLASLLSAGQQGQVGWCTGEAVSAELMRLGQAQPLQRRQWSRLIDGLRECFAKLGDDALRDFDQRFEHGPRRRTVGPWCWRVAPGDVWEVVANTRPALVASEASAGPSLWPRLSCGPASPAQALCQQLLVAQTLLAEGLNSDGLAVLADGAPWADASPELQTLRHVMAAEAALSMRQFDDARQWADQADALCQKNLWAARLLSGRIRVLRLRFRVQSGLRSGLERRGASGQPVTSLGCHEPHLWLLEALETLRVPRDDAAHAVALAKAEAALVGALALADTGAMQAACTALSRLHAHARDDWSDPVLDLALQWHGLAESVTHRFDLPLHSAWEFLHIGRLWLDWPAESRLRVPLQRFMWHHQTPESLAFHQVALDLARQIGDPLQVACAAINLHRRAAAVRRQDEEAAALRLLVATMKAHPDLRALMVAEGWEFPAPLRRRRARGTERPPVSAA